MYVRKLVFVMMAALAAVTPAKAALILEYVQVASISAAPSAGPALASLNIPAFSGPTSIVFLQVCLRDTLGSGPEQGQGNTAGVPWQTNGGAAGPGSLGLGAFFMQFDSVPGIAVNPSPTGSTNARLIDPVSYAGVTSGTNPPTFTKFGGLLNGGAEPGNVPDPTTHRIALFNLRITALAPGSGVFHLRDQNPASNSADNAILKDADPGVGNGTISTIDDLIFSDTQTFPTTKTYDLPVVVAPEPSSMALCGLAFIGAGYRKLRRKTAKAAV